MVDARGLSCPEPVILTKRALKNRPQTMEVLVDNRAALENVSRYARALEYTVKVTEEEENTYRLLMTR